VILDSGNRAGWTIHNPTLLRLLESRRGGRVFSEIGTQAGLLEGYALFTIRTKDEFERALGAAPTGRVARFPWLGSGFAFVRAEVEDAQALVLVETGAEDISLHRDFARPAAEVWSFSGLAHPVSGLIPDVVIGPHALAGRYVLSFDPFDNQIVLEGPSNALSRPYGQSNYPD
jgi:hypothetical protein